jgi:Ca2+-binding RTX toxin-like protein
MSTKSFTINVNSGDVKTSLGSDTGYQQVQIGTGSCFTATLIENWVASADTKNDGTAILWAKGHNVDLSLAEGTHGWRVTNNGNDVGVRLTGSAQNDTLVGGAGDDTLNGGAGDDLLAGGWGSDLFSCNAGNDTITDLGRGGDALTVNAEGRVTAYLANNWTADPDHGLRGRGARHQGQYDLPGLYPHTLP